MRLAVILISVAAILAGCSDSSAPIQEDDTTQVDEEVKTTSLADGSFGFSGLDPGNYFLDVTKVGFDQVQASANVEAGVDKPPIVRVQLTEDPGSLPTVETLVFEGFIQCSVVTPVARAAVCSIPGIVGVDAAQGGDSTGFLYPFLDAAETDDITRASYDKLYAVNVAGTLFTLQAAARQMITQGKGGKIINMASQAGRRGEDLVLVYCSTKAAVISMTQSAGLDLIKDGINVNAIAPGVVDGEHWDHVDAMFAKLENKKPGQKKAEVAAGVPAGRFAVPADLAPMAVFLASDDANYIVAQTYNVDGGQWMS